MAEIQFANAAIADLDFIDDYSIVQFGEQVAETDMRGFDEAFALLASHPLAGPARSELIKGIRCLIHRQHRIFYHVDGDTVVIVRIVHHAMDARRVMKGAAG